MLASFGADDSPATVEGDTGTADAALARPSFSKALRASIAGQHAVGLTASQAQALRSYIARKYKIAHSVAGALINTAFVVAKEKKLKPQLVLAVIYIESPSNPSAESRVGAKALRPRL